jgi:hypothetical protein
VGSRRWRATTPRAPRVANLVLAALLTGHELGTLGVLHPALQKLPDADEVAGEKLVTRPAGARDAAADDSTVTTGVAATAALDGRKRTLIGAGTTAYALMLALTLAGNVPINARTLRWDVTADDPSDWRQLRRRWDRLHALRIGLDLGGLATLAAASLRVRR